MSYPVVKFCDEATEKVWADVDANAFDHKINLLLFQENYSTLLFHLMSIYCWEYKLFSMYPKERTELLQARRELKYGFAWGGRECLIYGAAVQLYQDHKAGKPIVWDDCVFSPKDSFLVSEDYKKCVQPKIISCLKDIRELMELIS